MAGGDVGVGESDAGGSKVHVMVGLTASTAGTGPHWLGQTVSVELAATVKSGSPIDDVSASLPNPKNDDPSSVQPQSLA